MAKKEAGAPEGASEAPKEGTQEGAQEPVLSESTESAEDTVREVLGLPDVVWVRILEPVKHDGELLQLGDEVELELLAAILLVRTGAAKRLDDK